jgi:short chain dehydrogenase
MKSISRLSWESFHFAKQAAVRQPKQGLHSENYYLPSTPIANKSSSAKPIRPSHTPTHSLNTPAQSKHSTMGDHTSTTRQQMPRRKFINKLQDKNNLIVGGTSGIGFATAETALEYGARVTITGHNPTKLSHALTRLRTAYPDIPISHINGEICDLSNLRCQLARRIHVAVREHDSQ